jgi:5-methylcytosine-specific restriction endonuclease McrBC regulatory subunit McrC
MAETLIIVEHQEIFIAETRDISNNIISIKDKEELLSIKHTDRIKKKRYVFSRKGKDRIKANSIVGSISLKSGLIIEILPKFAKNDLTNNTITRYRETLLRMIQVSNERNFISSTIQSSKISVGEMPLIRYMIELFSESLLHSLRNGIASSYNRTVENASYIKGNILLTKTIQNNLVDKSKVYISYNKHSSNNLLMQIFKTLSKLLLNDTNLSYRTKHYLYEVYTLLDTVNIISLKQYHFDKVIFNRLNDKYEILFKQAEFIYNQYMPFTSNINSTPFWAILFDMNYLFEKFCAYLLRHSQIEVLEQKKIPTFKGNNFQVSAKPDFIIQEQVDLFNNKNTNVVDAKWKLLDREKTLYGLDAQNFWQLFSYMNLVEDEEINGYFIVPKNSNEFDDEIIFEPIRQGKKSIIILSIDFSLKFEELIEKYRFKLEKGYLKIDSQEKKDLVEKTLIEREEKSGTLLTNVEEFNFEEFIKELETLHNNKNIRKRLSPNKKNDKFKNLFHLKETYNATNPAFKTAVKENLSKSSWDFTGLKINLIPPNIRKLKEINFLNLSNNNIKKLPIEFFRLKKLITLNISNNFLQELPIEIIEFKNLKKLIIDKEIVKNSIEIIKQLKEIKIEDAKNNDLSAYIESLIFSKEIKVEKANNHIDKINITLENYLTMSDDNKIDFCIQSNLQEENFEVIKKLCYEKNKDILIEILYKKTINIRFILLIYILNFKNWEFKEKYLFKVIKDIKNETLNYIIKLSENTTTYDVAKYIESNFSKIDNEIIFGYALSNINTMIRMREMISKNTNNLYLLDELSKNRDDKNVIGNIIFKGQNNKIFRDKVRSGNTIYSKNTLDRIAKYEQYYKYEDERCYIAQISGNYALSKETREYLFYKYQKDRVVLKNLNNKSLYYYHPKLKEKIEKTNNG